MRYTNLHRILWSLTVGLLCELAFAQNYISTIQIGHSKDITCLQYVAGDESLLTSGLDNLWVEWDFETQAIVSNTFGFTGGISCFDYNHEAAISVIGTYDNAVQIFDGKSPDTMYYGPTSTFEFAEYITCVAISPKGDKIVAASADFSLAILQNGTWRRLVTEGDIIGLKFSTDNKTLYFGNYSGAIYRLNTAEENLKDGLEKIYQAESPISDIALSPNEKLLAFGTAGHSDVAGQLGVVSIEKKKLLNSIYDYTIFLGFQLNTVGFFDKNTIIYKNQNQRISLFNFKKNQTTELVTEKITSGFALSADKEWCAYAVENIAKQVRTNTSGAAIVYKAQAENPIRFCGVRDNRLMVEYKTGLKEWDLMNLEASVVKENTYDKTWPYYSFTHDLKWMAAHQKVIPLDGSLSPRYYLSSPTKSRLSGFTKNKSYHVLLNEKGSVIVNYLKNDKHEFWDHKARKSWDYNEQYALMNINNLVMHPSENKFVLLSKGFDIFDIETGEVRQMTKNVRQGNRNLPALYDPFQNLLLVATSQEVEDSYAYEGRKGFDKEWHSVERHLVGSSEKRYINRKNGVISLYELDSLTAPLYLIRDDFVDPNADVTALTLDSINRQILIGFSDGTIKILRTTDSGYYYERHTKFTSGIQDLAVSEDGRFIFAITSYGAIGVTNSQLEYLVSLVSTYDHEFLVLDYEGYYKRSKNAQHAIVFEDDRNSVMRINQLDQLLNQPHRVMTKLGLASEDKIALVQRLAKNTENTSVSMKNPFLEFIDERKIDYSTSNQHIVIKTKVEAGDTTLDYMQVWVNGVPLYSLQNAPKAKNKKLWKNKWKLDLKYGKNDIRFVCYDATGKGSNERFVSINCSKPYVKPNLYLGIISVSEYQDSTMNLKYAVKDGRDLANVFVDETGRKQIGFPSRFGEIIVDTFFNEKATKASILEWRKALVNTKPEDYVVLYVSGHGLLDTNLNFYFATHDIQFDKPHLMGMSFSDLEDLLVAIPAQQKLFLMDACHSGEIIDEELTIDSSFSLPDGTRGKLVGYSYKGVEVEEMDGETVNKTELRQELFSNYESKSGATVISAASGNSFALESPDWNNGIFTYTVVGGLVNRWADANDDGEVSVVELSRYVTEQVKKQTEGLQIPNDRQENIENNFRIW